MRDEAHFSWDVVEVGDDDRTLVLRSIHTPSVWSDDDAWFNGGRADVTFEAEAVGVLLWLPECHSDAPGAARAEDSDRQVTIVLDEPLAGRVPYDGCYGLVEEQRTGAGRATRWAKVQVWDQQTLVVYWHGSMYPLDRVEVTSNAEAVFVKVLEDPPGKLAGRSKCTIVRLDEPIAGRRIKRGSAPR